MRYLKTNTAVIVTVGPFYDKTDGVTIEGSLTITNERITLTADTDAGSAPTLILDNITGATSGTANDLNYITNTDAGLMQLELAAADVNRLGRMFLTITDAANHVPVFHEFMVLSAAAFDWMFGSTIPPVNATQFAGQTISAAAGVTLPSSVASPTNITAGVITTTTNLTNLPTIPANWLTAAGTAADFTTEIQSGLATSAALATVDGIVDDILLDTAEIGAAGAGLTAINLPNQTMDIVGNITGNLSGSVGSVTGAVGSVTGAVGSVTGLTVANLDAAITTRATPAQILTTALTEAYAADGAAPTLVQALFLIQQMLTEFAISGTTLSVKGLDGTTEKATFTLDDATTPTSLTRAT